MYIKPGIAPLLLVLQIGVRAGFCLSPQEIKEGGFLRVVTRRKPTVYFYDSKRANNGLHYNLVNDYAAYLKVIARIKVVQLTDYVRLDKHGRARLFKSSDLYADNLTATAFRKRYIRFIPLFNVCIVLVYRRSNPVRRLADLSKLVGVILPGSSYNVNVRQIEKRLSRKLKIHKPSTKNDPVADVAAGRADYTILDSDQAVYFVRRYNGLEMSSDLLKGISKLSPVGWGVAPENKELAVSISAFFQKSKANGRFQKYFLAAYGLSFDHYRDILSVIDQQGNRLLRRAIRHYAKKEYAQSLAVLRIAMDSKINAHRINKMYDKFFLDHLKQSTQTLFADPVRVLEEYCRFQPRPDVLTLVRGKYPQITKEFLRQLENNRDSALSMGRLSACIQLQEIIVSLSPKKTAKTELRAFYLQRHRLKQAGLFKLNEQRVDADTGAKRKKNAGKKEKATSKITNTIPLFLTNIINHKLKGRKRHAELLRATRELRKQINTAHVPHKLYQLKEKQIESFEGKRYFTAAKISMANKNYDSAHEFFTKALVLNYESTMCRHYIIQIGKIRWAQKTAALKKRRELFDRYFQIALSSFLKSNYRPALDNITRAIALFPKNPIARKYFTLITDAYKLVSETEVTERSSYYEVFSIKRARIKKHLKNKTYLKARETIEELFNLFPHNSWLQTRLFYSLYHTNPQRYNKLLKEYYAKAKKNLAKGDKHRAHLQFQILKKIKPNLSGLKRYLALSALLAPPLNQKKPKINTRTLLARALKKFRNKKLKQALALYRQVLKNFPYNYTALIQTGKIENLLETALDPSGDPATLMKNLSPKRKQARKLYLRGQFYFRIKKYKNALKMWRQAIRTDPSFKKAYVDKKRLESLLRYL